MPCMIEGKWLQGTKEAVSLAGKQPNSLKQIAARPSCLGNFGFSPGSRCQEYQTKSLPHFLLFPFSSMSSSAKPRNRKERRAQAREQGDAVRLEQPLRGPPASKTLVQLAEERELLGSSSAPPVSISTTNINPDGSITSERADKSAVAWKDNASSLYLDIALYTVSLTLLHLTLAVLVHNQYAQTPPSVPALFYETTIASPAPWLLLLLVAGLHPRAADPFAQVFFGIASVACGCWLVKTTNTDAYLATMRKAPPLGTLWIWAVVELRWEAAVATLALVAGWGWLVGYSLL